MLDTKWKKFSRSRIVRVILNVLLIVTIVTGITALERIDYFNRSYYVDDDGKVIGISDGELYGNEDLQEEFKAALEDVLIYALKINCLEDNKDKEELLEKSKKILDEKWKNYKYRISFTTKAGEERIISNGSESVDQLLELPIVVSYEGNLSEDIYLKEWRNLYDGHDTDYYWIEVNSLVNDICTNNKGYSAFVSEQIVNHLNIYKDAIIYLVEGKFGRNSKIYEKIYEYTEEEELEQGTEDVKSNDGEAADKKKTDNSKSVVEKNLYGLTEKEVRQLYDSVNSCVLTGGTGYYEISIPLSALLGTPKKYNITFSIDKEYCASLQKGYQENRAEIMKRRQISHTLEYVLFYDGVAFVIIMLALLYVCGRRTDSEEVHYLVIDRCYVEIAFLAEAILFGSLIYYFRYFWHTVLGTLEQITMSFIPIVIIWLMTQIVFSLMRKIKGKQILNSSVCVIILKKIWRFFCNLLQSGKLTIISVILAIVIPIFYGIVIMFGFICLYNAFLPGVLLIFGFLMCSWIGIILLTYHKTTEFKKIYEGVEKVKSGDIKYQINVDGSGMMHGLAENINSLSDGLEDAVNEMIKSERLKTELISNVSHDIKTPLTSIITYVDLLKKEEVQPEKAKEYIEVLEQKSQRLKYLTDDLFEAAKASSGAMSMELVKLDIGSLVNQGIGEFTEKLEQSNLLIKNNVETEQYFVKADGRLLWRIFENILSNVSKYALPESRVYIDAIEQRETIMVTVKNISAYELNISSDELMERFTRGDRSRNTEGSGLGLNIAKSLAELQHGKFRVEIDGDLFKSVLILPKVK